MDMSARPGDSVKQAARSSPVSGIVFEDLPNGYGLKHLVDSDALLDHLTLGVLCEANALRSGLGAETPDNRTDCVGIRCPGHATRPVVSVPRVLGLAGGVAALPHDGIILRHGKDSSQQCALRNVMVLWSSVSAP